MIIGADVCGRYFLGVTVTAVSSATWKPMSFLTALIPDPGSHTAESITALVNEHIDELFAGKEQQPLLAYACTDGAAAMVRSARMLLAGGGGASPLRSPWNLALHPPLSRPRTWEIRSGSGGSGPTFQVGASAPGSGKRQAHIPQDARTRGGEHSGGPAAVRHAVAWAVSLPETRASAA